MMLHDEALLLIQKPPGERRLDHTLESEVSISLRILSGLFTSCMFGAYLCAHLVRKLCTPFRKSSADSAILVMRSDSHDSEACERN